MNSNCCWSAETLNSGQNRQFFVLCDLEIWWLTLKNNKAPAAESMRPSVLRVLTKYQLYWNRLDQILQTYWTISNHKVILKKWASHLGAKWVQSCCIVANCLQFTQNTCELYAVYYGNNKIYLMFCLCWCHAVCPVMSDFTLVKQVLILSCYDKTEPLTYAYIDGLVQDCSNSISNALELLQSCTKPSICSIWIPKRNHRSHS